MVSLFRTCGIIVPDFRYPFLRNRGYIFIVIYIMAKMLDYKNEPDSILEELMPWLEAMQRSCSLNNGNV